MKSKAYDCPYCGCGMIRNRGHLRYANDVQCWRCSCWYLLSRSSPQWSAVPEQIMKAARGGEQ
jgi:hypothetical protein